MPSDRGAPEGLPSDSLSLKPLISCMMGEGIVISSRVVVGAVGVGVVVDVGIGAGIDTGEGIDSTIPSSWTVWHGGDVELGGYPSWTPPCGGEEEHERTTQLVLLL